MTSVLRATGAYLNRNRTIVLIAMVFCAYTLVTFGFYWARTLQGDFDHFMLIGDMFGVPSDLAARGITPMYYGKGQTGWDGQFYYFMANDLFAHNDTVLHVDSPAYRYQRIGFALLAAVVAKVLFLGWVTPGVYVGVYFVLVLAATVVGAALLKRVGIHPAFILLWSLSVGTQVTFFNGLPDASADAFLILAMYALVRKRYLIAAAPFVMAMLSREAYVLFPSAIFALLLLQIFFANGDGEHPSIRDRFGRLWAPHRFYALVLPAFAFVGWQAFVTHHFGIRPSEQAGGVTGKPFVAWWDYLYSAFQNDHIFVGSGWPSFYEAMGLIVFMSVLILVAMSALMVIARKRVEVFEAKGFAFGVLALVLVYVSFGPVVIAHYTGYIKAVALFFFAIPFLVGCARVPAIAKAVPLSLLVVSLVCTSYYHLSSRILQPGQPPQQFTRTADVSEVETQACAAVHSARITVKDMEVEKAHKLGELFGETTFVVIPVEITNLGSAPMVSTKGMNGTRMSYEWLDRNGVSVVGGDRTSLPDAIAPQMTGTAKVVVTVPENYEELTLKLSPVQEGCDWYYREDANNTANYPTVPLPSGL